MQIEICASHSVEINSRDAPWLWTLALGKSTCMDILLEISFLGMGDGDLRTWVVAFCNAFSGSVNLRLGLFY